MAEADRFTLTLRVDASLQIKSGESGQMRDWIKPGSETAVSWSGLPSDEEVILTSQWMREKILDPTIEEFILTSMGKMQELNEGL